MELPQGEKRRRKEEKKRGRRKRNEGAILFYSGVTPG
jgi:hypothetical protein